MVVVNFKLVMGAEGGGWLGGAASLLEGRAAATFVVLAGMGISLATRRSRESGDPALVRRERGTLLRRALFLFLVGALYTPVWPADILHFYGVYIALAACLIRVRSAVLWGAAALLVGLFVLLIGTLDYEAGWNWETLEYAGLWTPSGAVRNLLFNGFHPVIPWLAFLLVGMALGRLDWGAVRTRRLVFVVGAAVTALVELASRAAIHVTTAASVALDPELAEALFGTSPMPPMPLYMLAGGATAGALIALCVGVGQRWGEAGWLRPLVATGQLALTLYVAHVVLGMGALEVVGRLEDQSITFALGSSAAFCVGAVLFAHLWRRRFARGPLEALMRRLTDPPAAAE